MGTVIGRKIGDETNADVGPPRRQQVRLPGKYRHGLALSPRAGDLAEALLALNGDRALDLLVALADDGLTLEEIEDGTLAPALTKLGEMWIRGRVEANRFSEIGSLAESVERQFRRTLGLRSAGNPPPGTP